MTSFLQKLSFFSVFITYQFLPKACFKPEFHKTTMAQLPMYLATQNTKVMLIMKQEKP